jgi:hypothetical protein
LPVDLAKVYLFDSTITVVDSCNVDTLGFYSFYQKAGGNYKLSAKLQPASMYFMQNYLSTYYPDKLSYAEASTIHLNANAWAKDIYLQKSNQISEISTMDENISIYPNPAVNELFISINAEIKGIVDLKIFNINGQMVYNNQLHLSTGKEELIKLNIQDFKKAIYFMMITSGKNTIFKGRFVKAE